MHTLLRYAIGLVAAVTISTAGTAIASYNDNNDTATKPTGDDISVDAIRGPRLLMPMMNPANGRKLFAAKGCVVCHAVNGVGGVDAPAFDTSAMAQFMSPFDFAANMWRGAAAMIALQEDEIGEQIELNGQELADIIAFVHSAEEQAKFSEADIPDDIKELMPHDDEGEGDAHAEDEGDDDHDDEPESAPHAD